MIRVKPSGAVTRFSTYRLSWRHPNIRPSQLMETLHKRVTACVIIIGNEILSGRTSDANLAYLGQRLGELGIHLYEARVIPDTEDAIINTVNQCRRIYDYVFTTGGIGPTHDDITSQSIAKAFGTPIKRDAEAVARLKAYYGPDDLNEERLSMANVPKGARLIDNPVSAAPGFEIENVWVLAGVPAIMRVMFEGIVHRLTGGAPILSRTVSTNLSEGQIANGLKVIQAHYPDVIIGSYPFFRKQRFGISIVLRGVDARTLNGAAADVQALVVELGGELPAERKGR